MVLIQGKLPELSNVDVFRLWTLRSDLNFRGMVKLTILWALSTFHYPK